MTTKNDGTFLQDCVWAALLHIQETHPAMAHRYTDSKAARNMVSAQPADYALLYCTRFYLIECKSTSKQASLRELTKGSATGKRQLAKARQCVRAGGRSLFIYYNAPRSIVSIHNGHDLTEDVWTSPLLSWKDSLEKPDAMALQLLEIFNAT